MHPDAQLAAEAAEAAADQGAFWSMHDLMLTRPHQLRSAELLQLADDLGLDGQIFHDDLAGHHYAARIAPDAETADLSGASGTPTFFINGHRYYGAYDVTALTAARWTAHQRSALAAEV